MTSSIAFLEEHGKKTIWEDVDLATSLIPDHVQFMQLGPMPGAKLYLGYEQQGKLIAKLLYECERGKGKI